MSKRPDQTMEGKRIPLADLLAEITQELRTARDRAADPVMKFQECEIEFAIEAEVKAEGGLRVWVLNLGGGIKKTDSNTIKIKYQALEHPPGGEIVAPGLAPEGAVAAPARKGTRTTE